MRSTNSSGLFPIDTSWTGKFAIASRPRGGDWLTTDISRWRDAGVQIVVSLLTSTEEGDLQLKQEGIVTRDLGLEFLSCPIPDRGVPDAGSLFRSVVDTVMGALRNNMNVAVHCRQGVGRSAIFAACVLHRADVSMEVALKLLSEARGTGVPETEGQRQWLLAYAASP